MKNILQFTKTMKILACCLIFIFASSGVGVAETFDDDENENSSDTKLHVASGVLTLFYLPVKAAYAGLGGIVGGMAYIFGGGDEEVAQAVWTPAIKGTYILTPEHLQGEKPVQFFGKAEGDTSQYKLGRGTRLKKPQSPK